LYKKILNDDSKENTWPRKGVGGFNCLTSVSDIDRKNLRTMELNQVPDHVARPGE